MGTAKRERQKANRQQRLQDLAKQARKQKSKRMGLRIGSVVLAVVVIVGLINFLGGDDDESATPTSSTAASTVPGSTVPACPTIDTSGLEAVTGPAKPDVVLPDADPASLLVTTLTEGTGPKAQTCDLVRVFYVGVLSADGTEFDTNFDGGQPLDLQLGQGRVIQGWEQGLVGVQAGGRYQLDIPSDLAYGEAGRSPIPPNAALTFVVEIAEVILADGTTSTTTPDTTSEAVDTTTAG